MIYSSIEYKNRIIAFLKRDYENAKNYLKVCSKFIQEANTKQDDENLYFWASQKDEALMQMQNIAHQLNHH